MLKGRLAKPKAQTVMFRIILYIVSIVIISLVIYTLTLEKIRTIAVMKLIGAPNWVIIRMVLEESVILTTAAFSSAWCSSTTLTRYFPDSSYCTPVMTFSPS